MAAWWAWKNRKEIADTAKEIVENIPSKYSYYNSNFLKIIDEPEACRKELSVMERWTGPKYRKAPILNKILHIVYLLYLFHSLVKAKLFFQ